MTDPARPARVSANTKQKTPNPRPQKVDVNKVVEKCESQIDNLVSCITPEKCDSYDLYLEEATACLAALTKGDGYWKEKLPLYTQVHADMTRNISEEIYKKDSADNDVYLMAHVFDFPTITARLLYAAIASRDPQLLETVKDVVAAAIKEGKFKDFVDYKEKTDLSSLLEKGHTFGDNAQAALILFKVFAIKNKDPMVAGWEKNYLEQVQRYFPLQ